MQDKVKLIGSRLLVKDLTKVPEEKQEHYTEKGGLYVPTMAVKINENRFIAEVVAFTAKNLTEEMQETIKIGSKIKFNGQSVPVIHDGEEYLVIRESDILWVFVD